MVPSQMYHPAAFATPHAVAAVMVPAVAAAVAAQSLRVPEPVAGWLAFPVAVAVGVAVQRRQVVSTAVAEGVVVPRPPVPVPVPLASALLRVLVVAPRGVARAVVRRSVPF